MAAYKLVRCRCGAWCGVEPHHKTRECRACGKRFLVAHRVVYDKPGTSDALTRTIQALKVRGAVVG